MCSGPALAVESRHHCTDTHVQHTYFTTFATPHAACWRHHPTTTCTPPHATAPFTPPAPPTPATTYYTLVTPRTVLRTTRPAYRCHTYHTHTTPCSTLHFLCAHLSPPCLPPLRRFIMGPTEFGVVVGGRHGRTSNGMGRVGSVCGCEK